MKFIKFQVEPCIRVDFHGEGELYYSISEDQDPQLLAKAEHAEIYADRELPEGVELRWAVDGVSVAVREEANNPSKEVQVSGEFSGLGWAITATYWAGGEQFTQELTSGVDKEQCEQVCAALNALLEPVRIVADISGGALHGTYSDGPAVVLYISNDIDDVQDFDEACLVPPSENMDDPHAWWKHEAEMDGVIVDHFYDQVKRV